MAKENKSRKLHFLDLTIINTGTGEYEFKIHRKNAITNVQITTKKPHSYVNPALIRGIQRVCIQSIEAMFWKIS